MMIQKIEKAIPPVDAERAKEIPPVGRNDGAARGVKNEKLGGEAAQLFTSPLKKPSGHSKRSEEPPSKMTCGHSERSEELIKNQK